MSDLSNELKRQLNEASNEYRDEIQMAINQVVDRIGKSGINALVITGSLLVSYLLYRGISGSPKSKKKKDFSIDEEGSVETQMYSMLDRMADKVLEQTLVFLLTLAKERLLSYLNETSVDHDNNESPSGEEPSGREIASSLN